ncbi:MAG TPA: shikimate kinase [Candidatus Nanoarchaeia archaeon]|nr:shikimate kinase [Candidatus Nanoarchaeia archaeon]
MTTKRAEAIAHGAATIINAMATGEGAAFGVDLWTKAEVKLTDEPGIISGEITSDPSENTLLIEKTVTHVLKRFKAEKKFGAKVKTQSSIPIARGLKSSSVAANAVSLATLAALGEELDDYELVNIGVDAAFDAKVTVTGAFDDACASYFGGLVVTDNTKRKLMMRISLPEGLSVLFHIPSKKEYSANSDLNRIRTVAPLVKLAFREAVHANFWTALSLNGLLYSSALGFNPSVALDALGAGALAAGLCGKGPAVTAVVSDEKIDQVKTALQSYEGRIMQAQFNLEKASVVT